MQIFQQASMLLHDDMYEEFKIALIQGKWRSGEVLTEHQRKICEEVVTIRESYKFEQPETSYILNNDIISHKPFVTVHTMQ